MFHLSLKYGSMHSKWNVWRQGGSGIKESSTKLHRKMVHRTRLLASCGRKIHIRMFPRRQGLCATVEELASPHPLPPHARHCGSVSADCKLQTAITMHMIIKSPAKKPLIQRPDHLWWRLYCWCSFVCINVWFITIVTPQISNKIRQLMNTTM